MAGKEISSINYYEVLKEHWVEEAGQILVGTSRQKERVKN